MECGNGLMVADLARFERSKNGERFSDGCLVTLRVTEVQGALELQRPARDLFELQHSSADRLCKQ